MTPAQRGFQIHASVWFAAAVFFLFLGLATGALPWLLIPPLGWGIGLAAHATAVYTHLPHDDEDDEIEAGEHQRQLGY